MVRQDVIRWHQQGFGVYRRRKSRGKTTGRPKIDAEIRNLFRRMSLENPLWAAPRIRSELRLLGCKASKAGVDLCKVRHRKSRSRSRTWWTFLDNHVRDIVAVDFFTVPTATFRILFSFIVLRRPRCVESARSAPPVIPRRVRTGHRSRRRRHCRAACGRRGRNTRFGPTDVRRACGLSIPTRTALARSTSQGEFGRDCCIFPRVPVCAALAFGDGRTVYSG